MVDASVTSHRGLLRVAYADSTQLAARVALYDHQDPKIDLVERALSRLKLAPGARVLDMGCGYGRYVHRLAQRRELALVVGADLSEGMVHDGRATAPGVNARWITADAQNMPFHDGEFDAVLAMHMLYHVPDIRLAIREARRALRDGGFFLVSTPGDQHLLPLYQLMSEAAGREMPGINDRFGPHQRDLLDGVFGDVAIEIVSTEVVLRDAEPAVAFVESTRALREPLLDSQQDWGDVIDFVRDRVQDQIARQGVFRLPSEVAVFRCR